MSQKILQQKHDRVLEITLNYPDKLNCMGFDMLRALDDAVRHAAADPGVRVLMIRGAGERAFSTGADLTEFRSLSEKQVDEWIALGHAVFNRIEKLPKPTVALINGYAIGGGLELALACDFRVGTPSAMLASVELQHGWLPGWGGMTRLRRLIGESRAKEVVMLCEKIPAPRALELGLLTRILDKGIEDPGYQALIDHLSGIHPGTFREAKTILMDPSRTTTGEDVRDDSLAMKAARKR